MFRPSPPKNHVGGNLLRPKCTVKSSRGVSKHIRPIYRKGYGKKACLDIFPGDVKTSAKQKNMNQIFDQFLLGRIKPTEKKIKSGECRMTNNNYFVNRAVRAIVEVRLSARAPKLDVSLKKLQRSFYRKTKTIMAKLF